MATTTPSASFVEAKLQYLSKDGAAQAIYTASEAGTPVDAKHQGQYEYHSMTIHNGRNSHNNNNKNPSWSIDREGFQLLPHKSSVQDFYDDIEIERVYNTEITNLLLQAATGAKQIYIFDHTRRSSESDIRTARQSREPSSVIHNDYTERSARTRLQDFVGDEQAKKFQGRFAIINVWRSIDGTIENWPLTFCDSTTLAPQDVIPVKRMAKNRIGEIQMASFNPDHNWYYFPQMTPAEVVLIKTYDSSPTSTGINNCTLHTAFPDPTARSDARPRQSMETRAFVFY